MDRNTRNQHQASTQPDHKPQDVPQQLANDQPTRPTRVIKTRSMTSTKPTTSSIAFGASIPQRKPTRPLPRRKQPPAAQKPRAELKNNQLALNQNSSQQSSIEPLASNKPNSKTTLNTSPPVVLVQTSVEYKRSKAAKAEQKENQPDADSVLAPLPIRHQSQAQLSLTADPFQSSSSRSSGKNPGPSSLASDQPIASTSTDLHSGASKVTSIAQRRLDHRLPPSLGTRRPSLVASDQKLNLPGKRLFEEIDSGTQDIFSFLDNKPQRQPKNLVKSSTRPVFKPNQPLYLKNIRPGPAPAPEAEAEAAKRKPRALASSKLLAGAQPQKKRLKLNSAHPPTTSLGPLLPNPPASARLPNINLEDFDLKNGRKEATQPEIGRKEETQPEIGRKEETQPAQADLQAPPITKPAKQSAPSPQIPEPKRATRTPSPAASATRAQSSNDDRTGKPSSAFLSAIPTVTTLASPQLTPTGQRAPVKRAFEATSIHPLPASPPTPNPARAQKDAALVEETSADDIDFLSPKKKSKASPDAETSAQGTFQAAEKSPVPANVSVAHQGQSVSDARLQLGVTSGRARTEKKADVANQPEGQETLLEKESASMAPTSSAVAKATSASSNTDAAAMSRARSAGDAHSQSGVCPLDQVPIMDSGSTTPPISPSSPSVLLAALEGQVAQPRLDRPATPESKAVRDATPSPRPSPKLIPTRTSPIKHATLPTSIPILKATPTASRKLVGPDTTSSQPSVPAPVISQPSRRPSMLPRRALKPSMGTKQPVTFNVVSNLDAIVEASPEKRPTTRDAMSAASLNLSRGVGEPRKMIFSGGIKIKGAEVFGRPPEAGRAVFGLPSEAGRAVFGRPAVVQEDTSASTSTSTSGEAEPASQAATGARAAEGALAEEEPTGDMSSASIASQYSALSTSSSSSNSSSSSSTLANFSLDTQDRLSKLRGLLSTMKDNRANESAVGGKSAPRGVHQVNSMYVDSEEPLKDSQGPTKGKSRRRSSSVPTAASQTCGLGSSTASGVLKTSQAAGHERTGSRQVARRVSNILPSARIELGESRTDKGEGGSGAGRRMKKETALKDVVAFLDVRTAEGDDAGKIFVEMLKGLGAKVVGRPTLPLTHIIFKAGKQATIDRWLSHPRPKPFLVGIGWIVRCRELVGRAGEEPYMININSAQAPFGGGGDAAGLRTSFNGVGASGSAGCGGGPGNRRKSMEPKALALLNSGVQIGGTYHPGLDSRHPLSRSCIGQVSTSSGGPVADPTAVLEESIAKARRKSLQFLPKVGSPLNKVYSLDGQESGDQES